MCNAVFQRVRRPEAARAAALPPAQPTRPWRYNSGFSGPHDVAARYARWLPRVVKPATRASSVDPRGARRFTSSKDSMSLQCGIVGLPNVGKSTLFNALTKAGIAAENYPFCTIEPNVGVVEVPDPRLAALVGNRQARAHGAGHGGIRRYRGPRGRREQGRRPGQQVPREHPRNRCHHARRALLRRRKRDSRREQDRPAGGHRSHQYRTGAGGSGDGRKGASPLREGRRARATTRKRRSSSPCWKRSRRNSIRRSPCARWT